MSKVYKVTEDEELGPYAELLSLVEIGDYLDMPNSYYLQKTGWRSSRKIDQRHLDRHPVLAEYIVYMQNAEYLADLSATLDAASNRYGW